MEFNVQLYQRLSSGSLAFAFRSKAEVIKGRRELQLAANSGHLTIGYKLIFTECIRRRDLLHEGRVGPPHRNLTLLPFFRRLRPGKDELIAR